MMVSRMVVPNDDPQAPAVLGEWMSRGELASELEVAIATLARWETRRIGPPCIRVGRKVRYRRAAVQEWLRAQELRKAGGKP